MLPLSALTKRGVSPAFFLVCTITLGVMLGTLPSLVFAADGSISSERQVELKRLVRNDCGSCHGLTLKGGLGPSLLPESLHGITPEALRETILRGRTGTAMPAWSAFITEVEANWIVERLMKGFPNAN